MLGTDMVDTETNIFLESTLPELRSSNLSALRLYAFRFLPEHPAHAVRVFLLWSAAIVAVRFVNMVHVTVTTLQLCRGNDCGLFYRIRAVAQRDGDANTLCKCCRAVCSAES